MDGLGAHCDDLRVECGEFALGGTGHHADYEGEEAPGDAGWEEVLRSGVAVQGDAEVEQGL